jgi:hypothetical protein
VSSTRVPILAADLSSVTVYRAAIVQRDGTSERAKHSGSVFERTIEFGICFYGSFDGVERSEDAEKLSLPCVFTESQPAWNSKKSEKTSGKGECWSDFRSCESGGSGVWCLRLQDSSVSLRKVAQR